MIIKKLPFKPLLLFFLLFQFSLQHGFTQGREISGKVTDAKDGSPLPGVNVRVKEVPTVGTVTDASGNFSLQVPEAGKTLEFSFVGYSTIMMPITGSSMNVKLSEGASLEEVVVVGYGTQKSKDVSSAITSISAKRFNKGVEANPIEQIQGKVAGLSITTQGGDPNSDLIIRLRGQASLSGSQTPLIVVDGVPLSDPNEIRDIPPGDIASYDVLKDASATAIYGSRGANGVIIINTKRGQPGQTRITYNGYVGTEFLAKDLNLLSASQWKTAVASLGINPTTIASYEKGGNTDWYKAITQKTLTQGHNVSISGGSNNFNYRGSFSYINQPGIVLNSGRQELGLRFNAEQKALDNRLDIRMSIVNSAINRQFTDYGVFNFVQSDPPTYPVYNPDGSFFAFSDFEVANPVEHLKQETNTGQENLTITSGTVSYEITKGLTASLFGSLQHQNLQTDWFYPSFPVEGNFNNANKSDTNVDAKIGNMTLAYQHQWGLSNFTATGVYEYNDFSSNGLWGGGYNYLLPSLLDNGLQSTYQSNTGVASYRDDYKLISFVGRITYNYNSEYYLDASFRRDGSSKLGINNQWGNFPAISAAWRISQESFLKSVVWLNDLKIRAGYGVTGNTDGINAYNSLFLLASGGTIYSNGLFPPVYGPNQNANPDLKWEEVHGLNIGADFSILNNRVGGDINVYSDKTENLLYDYTVPTPPFYLSTILANVGTLTNKGVEISLNADIIEKHDFSWSVSGQISFNRTTITSLSGSYQGYKVSTNNIPGGVAEGRGLSSSPITYLKVGYSPYVFYLPHYVGLDGNGNQLYDSSGSKTINAGNATLHYTDPAPKFNYGINNTFTYKKWSLNFFLRGVSGEKVFNNNSLELANINRLPGNNVTQDALTNGIKNASTPSDYYLQKASFLRLDNATLSYTFGNVLKGVEDLQVYISGNNLFVITPYKGLDPEIRNAQINGSNQAYIDANYAGDGIYPKTRSFSFGVNVSFK